MKRKAFIIASVCSMFVEACAFNVIHVQQIPAHLDTTVACAEPIILTENLTVRPSGGYERTLKEQTRWDCVGTVPQGYVYRTRDQILTLEGSHVYEANLVVSSGNLVGFYLQVERTFSPLNPPAVLPMD